ncbi:hypothetical protein BDV96DRAFT_628842 [Lophiotrema nucula]|uniref:Cytochrome b561 domain-containing protein n=1 Tax=Lophiotrema nucula TaxID=690887 RepID=A0A6A5ZQ88_9PLEO|nr:hypothetical protein BDV96DRAFT_628842 [Lophiotrema nucula]
MSPQVFAVAAFWLASVATAISTQCPTSDVCFSLSVPDSTVTSGNGDIFFSLTGPTNYSWISLAQGEQMDGAHFFIMYTSASGTNVTVSPRLTSGHHLPSFDTNTQITLLEGTGVRGGIMTANVKCSNCNSWSGGSMDLAAQSTDWIWARATGASLESDDISAQLSRHDLHGTVTFGAAAHGGSDANPFVSPASPTASGTATPPSPFTGGGQTAVVHTAPLRIVRMYTAHSILACLAWAGIFPLGGIMIRLLSFPGLLWVHAGLQISGYVLYIAAVGLGIELSINPKYWRMGNKHVIIGLTIFALFFVQGFTGYLHHHLLKKVGRRQMCSYIHMWTGRICIVLGMMNAGFGFQITKKGLDTWQVKTYIAFAVTMFTAYVVSVVAGELQQKKRMASANAQTLRSPSDSDSGRQSPTKKEAVATKNERSE